MTDSENKSLLELYKKPFFLFFLCFLLFIFHISIPFLAKFSAESLANAFDLMIVTSASLLAIPALFSAFFSISSGDFYENLMSLYSRVMGFKIPRDDTRSFPMQTQNFAAYGRSLKRYSTFFKAKEDLPLLITLVWGLAIFLFVFSASITATKSPLVGLSLLILSMILSILLYRLYGFLIPLVNSSLPDTNSLPTDEDLLLPFSGDPRKILNGDKAEFMKNNLYFYVIIHDDSFLIKLSSPLSFDDAILSWDMTDHNGEPIDSIPFKVRLNRDDKFDSYTREYAPNKNHEFPLQLKVTFKPIGFIIPNHIDFFYSFSTSIPSDIFDGSKVRLFYINNHSCGGKKRQNGY